MVQRLGTRAANDNLIGEKNPGKSDQFQEGAMTKFPPPNLTPTNNFLKYYKPKYENICSNVNSYRARKDNTNGEEDEMTIGMVS